MLVSPPFPGLIHNILSEFLIFDLWGVIGTDTHLMHTHRPVHTHSLRYTLIPQKHTQVQTSPTVMVKPQAASPLGEGELVITPRIQHFCMDPSPLICKEINSLRQCRNSPGRWLCYRTKTSWPTLSYWGQCKQVSQLGQVLVPTGRRRKKRSLPPKRSERA